eukprot:5727251-Prorocentrum_lima.AAC.1
MTSSLVGSEMCIRDSPSPSDVSQRTNRLLKSPAIVNTLRDTHHQTLCQRAVSYTHLTLPTICSV